MENMMHIKKLAEECGIKDSTTEKGQLLYTADPLSLQRFAHALIAKAVQACQECEPDNGSYAVSSDYYDGTRDCARAVGLIAKDRWNNKWSARLKRELRQAKNDPSE